MMELMYDIPSRKDIKEVVIEGVPWKKENRSSCIEDPRRKHCLNVVIGEGMTAE